MKLGSDYQLVLLFILSVLAIQRVSASCPYNCTNNGDCRNGYCVCNAFWTGKYCQYAIYPLTIGQPINGSTTNNSTWVYYQTSFQGASQNQMDIVVTSNTSWPTYAGIYAAYGYVPTYQQYDFSGTISNTTMELVIAIPRNGDWTFAVRGANMSFTIVVIVRTLCPNNCSMHGTCSSSGQCSCLPGWDQIPDCSQEISDLQLGSAVSDQTVPHGFNYYHLAVQQTQQTLTINLAIQRQTHHFLLDSDLFLGTASYSLFVGLNRYPNLTSYDYVSRALDSDQFVIRIEQPPIGDLVIGVWGHDIYNYTLSAYSNITCPNGCNGNGICLTSGICKCNNNWGEEDCSLYRQLLNQSVPTVDSINAHGKKFYSIVVTDFVKTVEFDFSVNPDSAGLNPNVLLVYQYDKLPHMLRYARKAQCSSNCSIIIENAPEGNHVIGVFNLGSSAKPLNYTLTAFANVDCPNNCSSNGKCVQSVCQCNQWYQNDDCSLYIEGLGAGPPSQYNTISQGQWRYYQFNVSASTFLVFYIQPTSSMPINQTRPNYRVFAQYNRLPSINNYIKATASHLDYYQELLIEGSANIFPGTWYFGVYGLGDPISYTVSASYESYCPRNCSGRGVCGDNFQCVCEPPYFSDDCSSQDLPISTGVFTAGTIGFDRWNYYHTSILGDDALEITVEETSLDHQLGLIWVFAKKNGRPTIDDNDYRNQSDATLLTILIPSSVAHGNWTIGVTGSPRNHGIFVERATYTLIALTGCETYAACSSCVADPNCGWCWNDLNDPFSGLCTAGDQHHSFTENCVVYQFDTCDISVPQDAATFKGVIFGIAVGLGALLLLGGIVLFVWRRHSLRQKERMKPTELFFAAQRQYQDSLMVDGRDSDSLLVNPQPLPPGTEVINTQGYVSGPLRKSKKKVKRPSRIAKYGTMLDAEGYSSLSNTIGVDVHTDDEDEESSSGGEGSSFISSLKD